MTQFSERVYRFAPSPTGFLHVGGARTAIFNWLLARQNRGKFFLRIEDTDRKRSTAESIEQIIKSISWLGLDWDDEIVFQSHRVNRHCEVAALLLEKNRAYRCFCSKEILQGKRQKAMISKSSYLYDGTCRNLEAEQVKKFLKAGREFTIRLKISSGKTGFTDGVHGYMESPNDEIGDFVILRADQTPVYQLAVVVDDHDLGVTDVLRGDDHLSNTPKQIAIFKALEWQVPCFAHLPLILGPDRNRLSKRHGAASVEEFREQGIMADALFNYLCLLGWSPGDDRELLSRKELIELFSLDRVNKANAVFDHQKLLWVNGQYLNSSDARIILDCLSENTLKRVRQYDEDRNRALDKLIDLAKQRAKTLVELEDGIMFFIAQPNGYDADGVNKFFTSEAYKHLKELRKIISHSQNFSTEIVEKIIREFAEKCSVKAAEIIHPLRLALTGKISSPGIFEVMNILGRDEVIQRLDRAIDYIDEKIIN